ncbi:hypothetical protein FDI21_gp212 [Pseudomonas phage Noxifer]|uniref:Uncharacterized protein n=1 Tax=Pseudomonas phage Noxifer TaxID=2006684 RepID=A0A1Y0T141_9CAUD|nr:hypothetical protein FDI21_gp212 [Pseudomonas phage Noxifer]ARV77499.1 hypothetical protein NOXIFER_334 [Pseudomonas phage Noxifer]
MFSFFNRESSTRRVLRERLASAKRGLSRAMRLHGVNSERAREFDKLVSKLESELTNA